MPVLGPSLLGRAANDEIGTGRERPRRERDLRRHFVEKQAELTEEGV